MLILGLIYEIALGPSGRVEASARVAAPGVVVIGEDVVRASSTPVHVLVRSALSLIHICFKFNYSKSWVYLNSIDGYPSDILILVE